MLSKRLMLSLMYLLEDFSRFLTPERKRLLEVIKNSKPNSIRELSQLLKRDYKNVNVDTNMLAGIGFVELRKDKNRIRPRVIYDEIEVKIHVSGSKDRKIPA